MIRLGIAVPLRLVQVRSLVSGKDLPTIRLTDAKRKDIDEIIQPSVPKAPVTVTGDECVQIGGRPIEHTEDRTVRIFRAAREATQSPWNNTKVNLYFQGIDRVLLQAFVVCNSVNLRKLVCKAVDLSLRVTEKN
ncbi:unnamed protein product [Nippostrongylus brasiliensis]|uniref:Uncharacterized protein n=1 Tax=Nippostrongylus brasiliensis TaxID=27835 RepID=A0A0N4YY26_NIPBR|nr:unnamed protein product [Nippostrongylus brasiliensis]